MYGVKDVLAMPMKRSGMSFKLSSLFGPAAKARADSIWGLLVKLQLERRRHAISSTATVVINAQKRIIPTVSTRLRPYKKQQSELELKLKIGS
jgi:hypothetical protein